MKKKTILTLVAVMLVVIVIAVVRTTTSTAPEPEVRTTGPWVDGIVIGQQTSTAVAVSKLQIGDIDVWWKLAITEPDLFEAIAGDPSIDYDFSYGGFTTLLFNVAGPYLHDGSLNPFSDAQIREAFNWLIDRNYIVGQLLGGMGMPIYALEGRVFPEHARYAEIMAAVEDYYAPDPDRARDVIYARMEVLGAELEEGTWHYDGEEITIRFIIRDDMFIPLYPAAGEYIADLMESVGFRVDRMLRPGSVAIGLLQTADPFEGAYHAITVGWSISTITRDQGSNFYQNDTRFVRPWPRWLALDPPEEYLELATRLFDRDYTTLTEREELFEDALWMRMRFSSQILLADIAGAHPWRSNLRLRTDLSSGFGWGAVQTIHFVDDGGEPLVGGTVKAEQYLMFSRPWNPVDGSGAIADLGIFRDMLQETGLMADGRDGLFHPWHIESATVTVKTGLPVEKTHDWVTLDFADEIQAPADAWVDWDAMTQRFITVGEKMDPDSAYYDEDFDPSANVRSVVYYPDDFYDVPMHDGSKMSLGDVVMAMIVRFDRAKPESAIYDSGEVSRLEGFRTHFRGVRIVSESPLIVESYTRQWFLDAEWNVVAWFPGYGFYNQFAPWHVISIGMMAESDMALAWGTDKAAALGVEWMDYTKGPSLRILRDYLDEAIADTYIPYGPTLGEYVTAAEVAERYANLKAWYANVRHFWTTSAPFYLYAVHPLAGMVELRRFEDHPDAMDRWMFLLEPLS